MIITASEIEARKWFAVHLLNTTQNDHVEVHELRGFASVSLNGVMMEIAAVASGTRCENPVFSVVLNPPDGVTLTYEQFHNAIREVEKANGLQNHPRAVVFHEKDGERHCHVFWSRIDIDRMKAINLPFYRKKLQTISREQFRALGVELPPGLVDPRERNPLNFTREQWQQAKRMGEDPQALKQVFLEAWQHSDSRKAFQAALERSGLYLARGDKRGFVAVDFTGSVYSLSRWLSVKKKDIAARIGDLAELPTVDQTKALISDKYTPALRKAVDQMETQHKEERRVWNREAKQMRRTHRAARQDLVTDQHARRRREEHARADWYRKGLRGLVDRFTGRHKVTTTRIRRDRAAAEERDRQERDKLIAAQLTERRQVQENIDKLEASHIRDRKRMRERLGVLFEFENDDKRNIALQHAAEVAARKEEHRMAREFNQADKDRTMADQIRDQQQEQDRGRGPDRGREFDPS